MRRGLVVCSITIICLIAILAVIQSHYPKHFQPIIHSQTSVSILQTTDPKHAAKQKHWFLDPNIHWRAIHIKQGDRLFTLFKHYHISLIFLRKLLMHPDAKRYFILLSPQQILYVYNQPKKKQIAIKYSIDNKQTIYFYWDAAEVKSYLAYEPYTKHSVYCSFKIQHGFSQDARQAGLTYLQIHTLHDIFAGYVNFSHNIHLGDSFSLLYEEDCFKRQKERKKGIILAATLKNKNKLYQAIRFTYPHQHTGYYSPDGRGVEPLFLKRPLQYKRISTYFTLHHYDPVLHIIHPHLGLDFAANYGTKIRSIGNGKIVFQGRKGGYGKTVIVQYNQQYKALYGHMSRFAKAQKTGSFVKKGEVIGYVGSTGWATGPHLHFEIYVRGIPRDPLKINFITRKSIPQDYLQAFYKNANLLLNSLKNHEGSSFVQMDQKNPSKK